MSRRVGSQFSSDGFIRGGGIAGHHHGAVTHEHLEYYLDEFTFRFNRRRSRSRGKLFFRLVQQAVAVEPAPYESLVKYARLPP